MKRNRQKATIFLSLLMLLLSAANLNAELPTFPGAEGFGAVSIGGQAGKVIKVTNLNSNSPGSLQAAFETEGARIVIFEVGGVISGDVVIKHSSLTIAGQTAPSPGITIEGRLLYRPEPWRRQNDIVVRFIRIRPPPTTGDQGDAVQLPDTERVILDHLSLSWANDEMIDICHSSEFTIQWCTIEESIQGSNVEYVRIVTTGNRKEGQLSLSHLPRLSVRIIKALNKYKPRYVFTFECGFASFMVSALQTFGFMRSMKHVILQFIMREKDSSLRSKIKYLIMRFIFSTVHIAVCSSTAEDSYYRKAFRWNEGRTRFIPCYLDPEYLNAPHDGSGGFILTAGRTFRDYDTFLDAVTGIDNRVIVVASPWNIDINNLPENVSVQYDQSVFLQAMAMGKAVVFTRTAGTVDYINHLENGLLVPPGDSREMRKAIEYLMGNDEKKLRWGKMQDNV